MGSAAGETIPGAIFVFDTETTGLDIVSDYPIGIAFSCQEGEGYYIPLDDKQSLDKAYLKQELNALLGREDILKVAHNLKFDMQMLENLGIEVKGPLADTMLMSYLIAPNERYHNLDKCCLRYLNYEKIPTKNLLGKSGTMVDVPLEDISNYACEDVDYTLRLYEHLKPELKEKDLEDVFHNVEMPLVPILAKMEKNGVFLDESSLGLLSTTLGERIDELEKTIHELAGESFNIKSPKQLQEILFEKLKVHEELGVKRLKKTKSGYSTDASVLEKLSTHPLVSNL